METRAELISAINNIANNAIVCDNLGRQLVTVRATAWDRFARAYNDAAMEANRTQTQCPITAAASEINPVSDDGETVDMYCNQLTKLITSINERQQPEEGE